MEPCEHWTQRGGNKTTKNKHVCSLMRSHPNDKNSHRCLEIWDAWNAIFDPMESLIFSIQSDLFIGDPSPWDSSIYHHHSSPPWVNWVRHRNCQPRRLPVFLDWDDLGWVEIFIHFIHGIMAIPVPQFWGVLGKAGRILVKASQTPGIEDS
jgi:hypothetical protein